MILFSEPVLGRNLFNCFEILKFLLFVECSLVAEESLAEPIVDVKLSFDFSTRPTLCTASLFVPVLTLESFPAFSSSSLFSK